jgi:predicted DNA-binding protein
VAAKKRGAPAPRPRSGFVTEEQRKTERLTLRLAPKAMGRLHAMASEHGWTVARTVEEALAALVREVEGDAVANESEGE